MKTFCFIALLLFSLFFIGCANRYQAPVSDQLKYDLGKPIDCSSAENDIAVLESEKISSTEQVKAGVKTVVPAAAARGILHRDYIDRARVASGEYNLEIDEKIRQIKDKCGPGN
ncbi:MAG: hypothetical protein PHG69_06530 [Candidatus Omnitrophica bacterium]|nr:hypothetical protein [Candidatus Omnitrophota bacterium]